MDIVLKPDELTKRVLLQGCGQVDGCAGHAVSVGLCVSGRTAAENHCPRSDYVGQDPAHAPVGGESCSDLYPLLLSHQAQPPQRARERRSGDYEVS